MKTIIIALMLGCCGYALADTPIPNDSKRFWDFRDKPNFTNSEYEKLYQCRTYEELREQLKKAIKSISPAPGEEWEDASQGNTVASCELALIRTHYILGEIDEADRLLERLHPIHRGEKDAGGQPAARLEPNTVDYRTLNGDTVIVGQLGVPLGTVVQVDATVVLGRSPKSNKDVHSEYLLKVSKVASSVLSDPPKCRFWSHSWDRVKLAPDVFSLYELKKGKKTGKLSDAQIAELEQGYVGQEYHLLVYEEGVFSGIPNNLPKDYLSWQDRSFGFSTHLIVLRIVEGPIAHPKH